MYTTIRLFCTVFALFSVFFLQAQHGKTNSPNQQNYPEYTQPMFSKPPDVLDEARADWNLAIGLNVGLSALFHNTEYEHTTMYNFYESVEALIVPNVVPEYTWEQFLESAELKSVILMPRYGLSGHLTYGHLPLFVDGEIITSSSGYQKFAYGVTGGAGRDFFFENDFYVGIRGGYKLVILDTGFGAETMVNSVGNKNLKKEMKTFFDPKTALGRKAGDLVAVRFSAGKYFGTERKACMGVEGYGELDLTDETVRIARMNVLGINAFMRFTIF
jgi:hypothetical protein